jgi:hypothetical protein
MEEKLKAEFGKVMFEIYKKAKSEAKYNATIFLQMITDRGGLATAKLLINSPKGMATLRFMNVID